MSVVRVNTMFLQSLEKCEENNYEKKPYTRQPRTLDIDTQRKIQMIRLITHQMHSLSFAMCLTLALHLMSNLRHLRVYQRILLHILID